MIIFIFLASFFYIFVGIFASFFLNRFRDDQLMMVLLLSEFLFIPNAIGQFQIKHLVLPIITVVLLIRRRREIKMLGINRRELTYILPFLVYFAMGFYWFLKNGMLPNTLTGSTSSKTGNFIVFYNVFSNFCLIISGLSLRVPIERIKGVVRVLGTLLLVQVLLMFLNKLMGSVYVPLLMPSGDDYLIKSAFSDMSRDGAISRYCYIAALFSLFFRDYYRRLLFLMLLVINLVYGGGRTDFIALIFIIVTAQLLSSSLSVRSVVSAVGGIIVLSVGILMSTTLMSGGQKDRFLDIVNPNESDEMNSDKNGRYAMWLYSIQEFKKRPILGNGVSKINYNLHDVAARNVGLGSSHQFYLSVLYAFGLVGFIPLIFGLIRVISDLFRARKYGQNDVVSFFIVLLLSYLLIQFMINGGIKKIEMLPFLFIGMLPQLKKRLYQNRI